jgi:hypothetical protein
MNNLSRAGKTILIIIIVVGVLSIVTNRPEPQIIYIQDPSYVQNIGEAQRRLKEQGLYHGKIDYLWGPMMDEAYGNYCAIQAIEGE